MDAELAMKKAIAVSRKYTDEEVLGGGAIKGKNCTIESTEEVEGGQNITFKWTLDDGTVRRTTIFVKDGEQGEPGEKGDKGDKGDPGEGGVTFTYDASTETVTVTSFS